MIQAPRGTSDILPEEQSYWQHIERSFEETATSFGFEKISTPLIEYKSVFEQGIGDATDIVDKQMYQVKGLKESIDQEDENEILVLRPEGTAGVVRAYVQYGMHTRPQPVKLFYLGPMFRYERPQRGRLRQHHQFGLELFGTVDPFTDAFLIGVVREIYKKIGLTNLIFEINSIGCEACRPKMKRLLVNYYKSYQHIICPTCQNRLIKNPLRLLDCKEESCQQIIAGAPVLIDHLCPNCKEHFKSVLEYLEELNIPYDLNPRLVRGLDYYTKTVFEVVSQEGEFSLGGGGRYDNLIKRFGGNTIGAIGFAGGIERTILEMKRQKVKIKPHFMPKIFLIHLGKSAKKRCLTLAFSLHNEGFSVWLSLEKESLKAQLTAASKLKIPIVLILGQKEVREKTIIVKNMLDGGQETIALAKLPDFLKKLVYGS